MCEALIKRSVIAVQIVFVAVLTGCGLSGDPDERTFFPSDPDPKEYQYVNLARQIASEKPCYLISHNSVSVMPLNSPGTRAKYVRSHCFSTVARRTARPELCEHVESVSTLLYAGHRNGREQCIQAADRSSASTGVGIVDHDAMFELSGLSSEEVDELMESYQLPENGRYCLIFSPEFFEAIERMPRFSPEDDLGQMKAVKWDPHPFLSLPGFPCEGKFVKSAQ